MEQTLFVLFGGVALAGAALAITRRNAVTAAVWLVVMFFGLAGTFVLLEAYFVAVVQVLVYAGAIMVLFLFVIMLLDLKSEDLAVGPGPKLRLPGILLSLLFFGAVVHVIRDARRPGVVAPRASALLRLPAPDPDPADPTVEQTSPVAPAPVSVAFAPRMAAWLPVDDALRGRLARPALAPLVLDWEEQWPATYVPRTYGGTVSGGDKARAAVIELGFVRRGPEGRSVGTWVPNAVFVDQDGDGMVEASEGLPPAAGTPTSSFDASFVAPGATLEVVVQQGGLAAAPDGAPDGSPYAIGKSLFDDWILPFEVTSVLLLGAIFGAVVLTKRRLA